MQPEKLHRAVAAKTAADILHTQHSPSGSWCDLISENKKNGLKAPPSGPDFAKATPGRQKQREDSYAGGEIFVLHHRWFWNCLPWVNADSYQNEEIYLAHTAQESKVR
jgi:hypothetical protein